MRRTGYAKKCGKLKPGLMTGSVILSVFAFMAATIFITALFIRTILSEGAIQTALRKVDYTDIFLGDMLPEEESSKEELTKGEFPAEDLHETEADAGTDASIDLTGSDLEKLLKEAAFNDYLSEKLAGYAQYAVTGESPDEITAEEIAGLVADNKDTIEKATGKKITDEDIDKLKEKLEENDVLNILSLLQASLWLAAA